MLISSNCVIILYQIYIQDVLFQDSKFFTEFGIEFSLARMFFSPQKMVIFEFLCSQSPIRFPLFLHISLYFPCSLSLPLSSLIVSPILFDFFFSLQLSSFFFLHFLTLFALSVLFYSSGLLLTPFFKEPLFEFISLSYK